MTQEGATPPGFWKRIEQMIDERVAKAMRSAPNRNSSLSGGGKFTIRGGALVVEHDSGALSSYIGGVNPALPDGSSQPGFILYREDGSLAAALYDPDPDPDGPGDYKQFFAIYDRGGRIIMSDDTTSGEGLARPYIPGAFYRDRYADWVTTTSGAFETLFTAVIYKQHPQLYVSAYASNDTTGATGELRVTVNGVEWGTVATTGFSIAQYGFGPTPVDGDHMTPLLVRIQARLTSGAGGVRVEPRAAIGMQS